MVNSGIVLTGIFTITLAFVYSLMFGNRGKGTVRTRQIFISGAPAFVLLVLGISIICTGIVMP